MSEQSDLDRRLRAVERALTDGDHDVAALQDAAASADRLAALEERIETLEERTAELDAATQAVRGYVGNVRSVNQEVEERADAALAAVDRLERRLDDRGEAGAGQESVGSAPPGQPAHERSDRHQYTKPASENRPAGEGPAIEMPPPGSTAAGGREADDETGERSVIERVREAL